MEALSDDVDGLVPDILTEKDSQKLNKSLEKALENSENGKPAKAVKELNKFIKQVNKLVEKGNLPQPEGQSLIDTANAVIALLT